MSNVSKNDGGPAFPLHPEVSKSHFSTTDAYPGMTLRDYFAAFAMQGWLASFPGHLKHPAEVNNSPLMLAKYSYILADAMLKARAE